MDNDSRHRYSLAGRRVLIVIGPLVLGGAERQVLMLARLLSEQYGAYIELWATYEGGDQLQPYIASAGIPWKLVHAPVIGAQAPLRYRWRQLKRFVRFADALRRSRFDAVLPFMTEPNVAVSLAWRFSSIPVLVWNERRDGSDFAGQRILRAARLAARYPAAFIANSEPGREHLHAALGVRRDRIHVIRNGVKLAPPARNREQWRKELGVDERAVVACMVANLHPPKDHATLLRAWRRVIDRCQSDDVKPLLVLAGRFVSTHDELRDLARTLVLDEHVRFLGATDDIPGLLAACDIGVHSSKNEGTPNGLLECMAAGLPVVATDIPGIRDAVGDAASEFLTPVSNDEQMAERLIALINDPALRSAQGARNRARVEREYSPDEMAGHFAKVIWESLTQYASRV